MMKNPKTPPTNSFPLMEAPCASSVWLLFVVISGFIVIHNQANAMRTAPTVFFWSDGRQKPVGIARTGRLSHVSPRSMLPGPVFFDHLRVAGNQPG